MHGHCLELRTVGEEGHELRGLGFAVVRREGGVGFLLEDGDALGATAAVTDGEVHLDAVGL